jgi:hypothetical protein
MVATRYIGAVVLGIGSSIAAWLAVSNTLPIFSAFAPSGLVPTIVAGVLGGFICGAVAPRHKMALAAIVGLALAASLICIMVLTHMNALNRNPLLWYWPVYLLPTFAVGGILSRGVRTRAA